MRKLAPTVLFALLLVPMAAHAQSVTPGVIDSLVGVFQSQLSAMGGVLLADAQNLFVALVGMEIVFVVGAGLVAQLGWGEIFGALGRLLFVVGLMFWALTLWPNFSLAITGSFAQAGGNAAAAVGAAAYSPTDVFSTGMKLASQLWNAMSIRDPGLSILVAIAGIVVIAVYAVVVALMIEVIVESLFVAYAGVIMMGFGGLAYTRNYAEAQLRYAISVGVKRLVLAVLVGVCQGVMNTWITGLNMGATSLTWVDVAVIVGMPIVMMWLSFTIPYRAQDIVNGQSSSAYSSGLMRTGAAAAGATAAAALAVAGQGAAASAAFSLASQQLQGGGNGGSGGGDSGGGASAGGGSGAGGGGNAISNAATLTGQAARNYSKAVAADVGRRLTGSYGAQHGHIGFRVAADMRAQRDRLVADRGEEPPA